MTAAENWLPSRSTCVRKSSFSICLPKLACGNFLVGLSTVSVAARAEILAALTQSLYKRTGLRGHQPEYDFGNTTHLNLARLPLGNLAEAGLNRVFPEWEASTAVSLIVERSSLAAAVISVAAAVLLSLLRVLLIFLRRRELSPASSAATAQN